MNPAPPVISTRSPLYFANVLASDMIASVEA